MNMSTESCPPDGTRLLRAIRDALRPRPTPLHRLALTSREAADSLGVSVRTIERMVASGTLQTIQGMGRTLIPTAALESYVQTNCNHR